jgi:hypothetical protein
MLKFENSQSADAAQRKSNAVYVIFVVVCDLVISSWLVKPNCIATKAQRR